MSKQMRGVVLPGNRQVEIREFPVPELGHGQVLVRMKASSLCGSDLRAIYRPTQQGSGPEAYRGVIAGHEPCGQIEQVGAGVSRFRPGDRVILYHIVGCGLCRDCRGGWMISCSSPQRQAYGWQRDGGHAEFLLAEARTLVALPDFLSYVDGAMIACGFGTAYAACLRAELSGRDTVLVTGLGPVGLAVVMLARAMGARVIGVEKIAQRRDLAASIGCDLVLEPSDNLLQEVLHHTAGEGVEAAVECSANPQARRLCLEAARQWARVVFVGEGGTAEFPPSPTLIHKQLSLRGSWVCSLPQMEELVELLVRWQIHPEQTVTHRFALEQAREAYETFDSGESGKVVIEFA
jgi:threonine dehydrogenase-like Zn-dependent dehydrogenase